jgi:hypothetical protein
MPAGIARWRNAGTCLCCGPSTPGRRYEPYRSYRIPAWKLAHLGGIVGRQAPSATEVRSGYLTLARAHGSAGDGAESSFRGVILASRRSEHDPGPQPVTAWPAHRPGPGRQHGLFVGGQVNLAWAWQFAIYRASHDDYDESVFFTGLPVGTCQDALDTACGLYLNDPAAWTDTRRAYGRDP